MNADASDSGFVFIHIGKTAGTALRTAFETALGPGSASPPFVQSYLTEQECAGYQAFRVICGHISRNDQLKWFPDRKVMTVLRAPVERGFSFLNYVCSLPPESAPIAADARQMPILDLIETREAQRNLDNTMIRQLGGHLIDDPGDFDALFSAAKETLLEAIWVGFHSSLQRDIGRLQPWFQGKLVLRSENITPVKRLSPAANPEVASRLKDLSHYDRALWQWAVSRAHQLGRRYSGERAGQS